MPEAKFEPELGWPFVATVASSKKDAAPYTVTLTSLSGVGAVCTCPGYGFRARCRHIAIAVEMAKLAGMRETQYEPSPFDLVVPEDFDLDALLRGS